MWGLKEYAFIPTHETINAGGPSWGQLPCRQQPGDPGPFHLVGSLGAHRPHIRPTGGLQRVVLLHQLCPEASHITSSLLSLARTIPWTTQTWGCPKMGSLAEKQLKHLR